MFFRPDGELSVFKVREKSLVYSNDFFAELRVSTVKFATP